MPSKLTLDTPGTFTWCLCGPQFFVETDVGNFVWDDPDYCAESVASVIRPFAGTYKDWCKQLGIPYGRDKGVHTLREYCGDGVQLPG